MRTRIDRLHSLRALALALVVVPVLGGCGGDSQHGDTAGGNPNWPWASNGNGPCTDGDSRSCGIVLRTHDGVVDCLEGAQVCHGGVWGECGEKGPITTKSVPEPAESSADPTDPSLSVKGLGAPTNCATNPCDPYCNTFIDTTDGGLPLDGLVYADADGGGVTIPITPGVDGGYNADAIAGSSFGSKINFNGGCTKNTDCQLDQYCNIPAGSTTGTCTSWTSGAFSGLCAQPATTYGGLTPKVDCTTNDADSYNEYYGSVSVGQFDPTFSSSPLFVAVASPSRNIAPYDYNNLTTENGGKLKFFPGVPSSGATCTPQLVIPNSKGLPADPDGFALSFHEAQAPLLVDLNKDGVPEVVVLDRALDAYKTKIGLVAPSRVLAYSVAATGTGASIAYTALPYAGWHQPGSSIHGRAFAGDGSGGWTYLQVPTWGNGGLAAQDLDGDGYPEIIASPGYVISGAGQLIASPPAPFGSGNATEQYDGGPILADIDNDGKIELINRLGVFAYVPGSGWVSKSPTVATDSSGNSLTFGPIDFYNPTMQAVADFGDFGTPGTAPEIAWVGYNRLRLMTATGAPIMGFPSGTSPAPKYVGDIRIPGGGGGPINIADFDGDGLPEIGVAGGAYYSVFDVDCVAAGSARTVTRNGKTFTGTCNRSASNCDCLATGACSAGGPDANCAAGILWNRRTQDQSSARTGSTVFDFDADGKAEVVYGDECYTRIYDGTTGTVIYSTPRSSGTIVEEPVVADVNLDGRAELIVPNNKGLETTAGEGMYCPTTLYDVSLASTSSGYGYSGFYGIFTTTIDVKRPGTLYVRWAQGWDPSSWGGSLTLTNGGTTKTASFWPSPSGYTEVLSYVGQVTIDPGDPLGTYSLRLKVPAWQYYPDQIWVQGFPVDGSSAQVTISGTPQSMATDAFFAGLTCATNADCVSNSCNTTRNLCGCASNAQCPAGFSCIDAPGTTTFKSCRPTHSYGIDTGYNGVQVWQGPGPGWAMSRYTWNEHAYTPTNINDDDSVKTTAVCSADEQTAWNAGSANGPMTNSFRQQLQYPGATASGLPDLTLQYPCVQDQITVCNRGAGTAPPGAMIVKFPGNSTKFTGSTSSTIQAGPCYTTTPINPGQCVNVACPWSGNTGEWVINPTCHNAMCTTDADCSGSATCNTATGYCSGTANCDPKIPVSNTVQECTNNDGNWSFQQGNVTGVCVSGPTVPASVPFVRTFQAGTCPSGTAVKWGLFTYSTTDPVGTDVVFSFQTGATLAAATTAPSVTVATAGYAPIGSSTTAGPQTCQVPTDSAGGVTCPIDLSTAIVPNSNPVLIMTAMLNANTTTVTSPTLVSWNVTYDCVPSE